MYHTLSLRASTLGIYLMGILLGDSRVRTTRKTMPSNQLDLNPQTLDNETCALPRAVHSSLPVADSLSQRL